MKKKKRPLTKPKDELCLTPSDFSTAITRVAVAQICQSVGFKAAQISALETLTDVAARYLRSLAKSAAASASSTGRTQSNLLDILCALEELHSVTGFRGASNLDESWCGSSILSDAMKFVNFSLETPFAQPVPRRKPPSGMLTLGGVCIGSGYEFVKGRGNHIPKWLPAFPVTRKKEEASAEKIWGVIVGSSDVRLGGEKNLTELGFPKIKQTEKDEKNTVELELPRKRERVSFKLGMGKGMNEGGMELVRSGICRGGKRILCHTFWTGDEAEDTNKENKLQPMSIMELD